MRLKVAFASHDKHFPCRVILLLFFMQLFSEKKKSMRDLLERRYFVTETRQKVGRRLDHSLALAAICTTTVRVRTYVPWWLLAAAAIVCLLTCLAIHARERERESGIMHVYRQ